MKERDRHVWRKSIPIRGNSRCEGHEVECAWGIQRSSRGHCNRNGGRKEEDGGDEFGKHGDKMVQDILDHRKDIDFTLTEMRSPRQGFEQGSEGI